MKMLRSARAVGFLAAVLALRVTGAAEPESGRRTWRAGVARVKITPAQPVVLLGYGDRTGPYQSVAEDIYAKALALEDPRGEKAVVVTADLVGFQAAVTTDEVCRRIAERTGLARRQLLFNASHNHTAPLVSLDPHPQANSVAHPPLSSADVRATVNYTLRLREQLVELVCAALAQLRPAQLAWGMGQVGFPMNRRLPQDGRVVMAENPAGPTDPSVPVLRVRDGDGQLVAVLFGCACHNTTLTGRDNVICGDFAGFAQNMIEGQHPGATALYLSGCGADANPSPRGSMELARQHGDALSREVERVMQAPLTELTGNLVTVYDQVALPLQTLSRDQIVERTHWPSAESVMARHMMSLLDRGESLPASYRAPLAVWQFGHDLTLVALPAEPVAEYVSLLRRKLGRDALWVAGFNNDCFGYLPTARIVREGGHEAIGVTLWIWGQRVERQVGYFTPEVQEIVLRATRRLAQAAGRDLTQRPGKEGAAESRPAEDPVEGSSFPNATRAGHSLARLPARGQKKRPDPFFSDVPWLAEVTHAPARLPPQDVSPLAPLLQDDRGRPITTRDAWERQRRKLREAWLGFLGPMPDPRPPVTLEVLKEESIGVISRQLVRYESEPGLRVEGYLLIPDSTSFGQRKRPGLVALHPTTNATIDEIAGVSGAATRQLGWKLARRGFVVFCPRCFLWQDVASLDEAVRKHRQRHPQTRGMAKMLYDAMRGIDVLEVVPDVDASRIGVVGHSLGAKETLYVAAFDQRVKAAVASEGGLTFPSTNWDAPWYLGEAIHQDSFPWNHHQLLALIAPRPFLILGGESGPGAADGDRSWPLINAALPVWRLYGEPVRVGLLNHHQGHAISPASFERIAEWLETYLRLP